MDRIALQRPLSNFAEGISKESGAEGSRLKQWLSNIDLLQALKRQKTSTF